MGERRQPDGQRTARSRTIVTSMALLGVIGAAGFAGPRSQSCKPVKIDRSPQGIERITVRCVTPRWAFHFPPRLW